MQLNQFQQPQGQAQQQQSQMMQQPVYFQQPTYPQAAQPIKTEQQKLFDLITDQQNTLLLLNSKIDNLVQTLGNEQQLQDAIYKLAEKVTSLENDNKNLREKIEESPKVDVYELVDAIVEHEQKAETKRKPGRPPKKEE